MNVYYRPIDIFFLVAYYVISIPCVFYCTKLVATRLALWIIRKVERNPQLKLPGIR